MNGALAAIGPLGPHDRAGRRLASLDLLRGLSVIGMILVNLMAGMSHRGPVFPLLLHSGWAGFTIADAIFPAFILMVGVSVALTAQDCAPDTRRVLARAGRLVLLGLLFSNLFWLYDMTEGQPRLPGVLQRIGLVFAVTALVYRRGNGRLRVALVAAILLLYWPLCLLPAPDGLPTDIGVPGHDFVAWFDRTLFGSWRYVAGPEGYDPEGLLGTLPTVAEALIGTLVGDWLRRGLPIRRAAIGLALAGALLIVIGVLWGLVFPIIKDLWTSSFVLVSAGVAMVVLAGFHLACDGLGGEMRRGGLLGSFGRNAIAAYALHELTSFFLSADVVQWTYRWARPVAGPELAALVPVTSFILLLWWPIAAMDRRGWYLKT